MRTGHCQDRTSADGPSGADPKGLVVFEPIISFSGNLAWDPQLRTTATGVPVVDLRVGTTPRRRRGDTWEDSETQWYEVVAWNRLAQNVCSSLRKGDTVTVTGRVSKQSYQSADRDTGEIREREKHVVEALQLGVDLNRFPVQVNRVVAPKPEDSLGDRFVPAVPEEDELAA